jgi:hypothetical protein
MGLGGLLGGGRKSPTKINTQQDFSSVRLKSPQVQMPRGPVSPLGRALGAGQAVLGIVGSPASGGSSLLAVPGGLSAAKGISGGIDPVRAGEGPQVSKANPGQDQLSKIGQLGQLVGLGLDAKKKLTEKDAPVDTRQDLPSLEDVSDDQMFASTKRAFENRPNPQQDMQMFSLARDAEMELNSFRESNPELVSALGPSVYESIQEMVRRFKSGEPIHAGGSNGSSFTA